MKIKLENPDTPTGYTLWLSANDIRQWVRKPGAAWPCSTLRGHSLRVNVDHNGLCDYAIDGRTGRESDDIDGSELDAIVADHLPTSACALWPVWQAQAMPASDTKQQ